MSTKIGAAPRTMTQALKARATRTAPMNKVITTPAATSPKNSAALPKGNVITNA